MKALPRRPRHRSRVVKAATATALTGALLASGGVAGAAPATTKKPTFFDDVPVFTLNVLFSNDMESALLGTDGDGTDEGEIVDGGMRPYGSASRMATVFENLRKEAVTGKPAEGQAAWRGEVSVSGGDNFLAGPEFSASEEEGAPFYDAKAVAGLDLDATTIGNHEFDFGPELFADFIDEFDGDLPHVSANVDVSGEPSLAAHADDGTIMSSKVLRTKGQRVGMIGLTTPELPSLSSPREVEVDPEMAKVTNAFAEDFRKRGINKVIVVSHLQDIDNELELVPELRGVDAVIGAGGGEILANDDDRLIPGDEAERGFPLYEQDADGKDVPVVTTTGDYKYVGRLVLNYNWRGDVIGVDDANTGPVRVSGVGPDAVHGDEKIRAEVEEPVAEHLDELATTTVATSEVPLNGVRNAVRSEETNLGNLVADSLLWAGRQRADEFGVAEPQVGIQNGGGIRNDSTLPAGDITALNTYEVAPFSNFVAVVPEVPRETLRQLLERGVAALPSASGAFMQVAGVEFTYDENAAAQVVDENTGEILEPGERVQDVTLADGTQIVSGGEVVDGPAVSVATNDFSARGGDGYPFGDLDFTSVETTYQQAVEGFLVEGLEGAVTAADYPEGGEGRITPAG
ncbi:bifunctional metallophosphatase/5'-nucleotidase [Saccharomonospora sp. CUA-673]|uniref:bifunctional metallophosphatase/5'-nucleotidase n=1 Tax=Saccharomonospora sp. CUA-673 TaxID=1904969 RepID=UPI00095DE1EE|nr:5'-nucleotidase C-terminal domain-containing protein [Saccharomonospora sp. CUA-673]OLT46611.1 bifunctional metallophosphatase/5'-nucleotidase [Saccharomonospora sp. CUA-673]